MQLPLVNSPQIPPQQKSLKLHSQICNSNFPHLHSQPPQNKKKLSMNFRSRKLPHSRIQSQRLPHDIIYTNPIKHNFQKNTIQSQVFNLVPDHILNCKIVNQKDLVYNNLSQTSNQYQFLITVQTHEYQFIKHCINKNYHEAQEKILKMLNYAIDLNLVDYLCFSLKILADFHWNCSQIDKSFFYFNQGRKCAYLINQPKLMIQCLFQMSKCANKANMFPQSLKFLKKSLQYIWYYNFVNLELKVYDDMGKIYYLMGDAEKAKNYHQKYFSDHKQPKNSSIRLLSKQSLRIQGFQQRKPQRCVNTILLWMVRFPVKSCDSLQQFKHCNTSSPQQTRSSPRNILNKNMKYFNCFQPLKSAIPKVLAEQIFNNQIGEIEQTGDDWTIPNRQRRFLSLDIQRNKYLHGLGVKIQRYFGKNNQSHQNLQKNISNLSTECHLNQNSSYTQERSAKNLQLWYNTIVSETLKKYRSKNQSIHSRVQLRGMDKQIQPTPSTFRNIYNQFFTFSLQIHLTKIKKKK